MELLDVGPSKRHLIHSLSPQSEPTCTAAFQLLSRIWMSWNGKVRKRRKNVENAQHQSSSHLAIAKFQIWRRQVRQRRRPGFDLSVWRRETAVWRSRKGLWTFSFKYQPPHSVQNMQAETRGTIE
ncbi:hypothetical protein OSB04_017248 [Centaurea solstitialis]|uniref:Uncharacterized protein n=1 Tax=Centaurea solstitialis TaxID=347529 RepID=A0AA38TA44_9ASTR|nr:hypothetical protein OSB04_017248 [Centaurea solstitialis]